jgi:hypothetical protein
MAGIGSARNLSAAVQGVRAFLTASRDGTNGVPDDLRIQDVRAAPALLGILVDQFSMRQIVILTDVLGQPAVHQGIGLEPDLLIPRPILGLPSENFFQGTRREIFGPGGHSFLYRQKSLERIGVLLLSN